MQEVHKESIRCSSAFPSITPFEFFILCVHSFIPIPMLIQRVTIGTALTIRFIILNRIVLPTTGQADIILFSNVIHATTRTNLFFQRPSFSSSQYESTSTDIKTLSQYYLILQRQNLVLHFHFRMLPCFRGIIIKMKKATKI